MSPKLHAFLIHFGLSATALAIFAAVTLFWWYPGPLLALQGGIGVLIMLVSVDVVLGPSLTALVYKPGKRTLKFDLAIIVLVQLAALSYGVMTLHALRTHYLVFVYDRFFVVSMMDTVGTLPRNESFSTWRGPVLLARGAATPHTTSKTLDELESAGKDEALIPPLAIMAADLTPYPDGFQIPVSMGYALADLPDLAVRNKVIKRTQQEALRDEQVRIYRVVGRKASGWALVALAAGQEGRIIDILR